MKNETMYGYPLSSVLSQIFGLIILFLCILCVGLVISHYILLVIIPIMPFAFYFIIFKSQITFTSTRKKIINEMIKHSDLKEKKRILDIGTGSGYVGIHFAKELADAMVVGIDKYDLKNEGFLQRFFHQIKINFYGNSLQNAKKNVMIEKLQDKINFIKSDLLEPFPFVNNSFDLIVSSQFLYCIDHQNLMNVLLEIDRVLSDNGRLVFFESTRFMRWDIQNIDTFFANKGYKVKIIPLEYFPNKCIFIAQKQT